MPWGLTRLHHGGQSHFVTFYCYHRRRLFTTDASRRIFESALETVRRSFRLHVYGYVVMPEHVHLLLSEPQQDTLADAGCPAPFETWDSTESLRQSTKRFPQAIPTRQVPARIEILVDRKAGERENKDPARRVTLAESHFLPQRGCAFQSCAGLCMCYELLKRGPTMFASRCCLNRKSAELVGALQHAKYRLCS